jgi:hypothetical protein
LALVILVVTTLLIVSLTNASNAEAHQTKICGKKSLPQAYVPCRRDYVWKAVRSHAKLFSGTPLYNDIRNVWVYTIYDYGRHYWGGTYRFDYNQPGLKRARRCRGRVYVSAHTGRGVRFDERCRFI